MGNQKKEIMQSSQLNKKPPTRIKRRMLQRLPPRPLRRLKKLRNELNENAEKMKRQKNLQVSVMTTLEMSKWCSRMKLPTRSG
jgi:hypothetical protein